MGDKKCLLIRIWNVQYKKIQMIKIMTICTMIFLPINLVSIYSTFKLYQQRIYESSYMSFPQQNDIFFPRKFDYQRDHNITIREGTCESVEQVCQKNKVNLMVLCAPSNKECPPIREPYSIDQYEFYDVSQYNKTFQGFQVYFKDTRFGQKEPEPYPIIKEYPKYEENGYDVYVYTVSLNYYSNQTTVDLGQDIKKIQDKMNEMITKQTILFIIESVIMLFVTIFTILGWSKFRKSIEGRYLELKAMFNPFLICIAFSKSDAKMKQAKHSGKRMCLTNAVNSGFVNIFTVLALVNTVYNYYYFIHRLIIQIEHVSGKNDTYDDYEKLQDQIIYDQKYAYYKFSTDTQERLYYESAKYWQDFIHKSQICYEQLILMKKNNTLLYIVFIINWAKILVFTLFTILDQIRLVFRYCRATVLFYIKDGDEFKPFKNKPKYCKKKEKPSQKYEQQITTTITGQTPKHIQSQNQFPLQQFSQSAQSLNQIQNQQIQSGPIQYYYPTQIVQPGQYYQSHPQLNAQVINQQPQFVQYVTPIIVNYNPNTQQNLLATQNQFSTQNM